MPTSVNVIDLFAGPGGLGEGFSAFRPNNRKAPFFQIRMSVEKEASAHKTLSLRALYRAVQGTKDSSLYHDYLAGELNRPELQTCLHDAWEHANRETLGGPQALGDSNELIHKRLRELKREKPGEPWVVIGGPPCQAYSLAGRSRNKGIKGYKPEADNRHFLYKEYLEVLSIIQPDIFVMENVKGILTSAIAGERIFPSIREDLRHPSKALHGAKAKGKAYHVYSFAVLPAERDLIGQTYAKDSDYIIRSETFGVPQARHRVILLGVCTDLNLEPEQLNARAIEPIENVLEKLPPIRSRLSKEQDNALNWSKAIKAQASLITRELGKRDVYVSLAERVKERASNLQSDKETYSTRRPQKAYSSKLSVDLRNWLADDAPSIHLNHEARGHIPSDLGRYLFSACWAEEFADQENPVPKASDFPLCLAPSHANWNSGHFADRFRVQCRGRPATTITSHISKDGHYYIHYDPTQCRSLTVREAARIQTFPDNYFFEGNRTQQYVQVGNAVPPFLARQLAGIVWKLLKGT